MIQRTPGDIDRINRKLELSDKINAPLVETYMHARDDDLLREVYRPLAEKYPLIDTLIANKVRAKQNVLKAMEKAEADLDKFRTNRTIMETSFRIYATEEQAEDLIEIFDKLDSTVDLCRQLNVMTEQYFVKATESIRRLALAKGIEPEEIIKSQEYRDEVERMIFPTRKESENFMGSFRGQTYDTYLLFREYADLAKSTSLMDIPPLRESIENMDKTIPTKEMIEALKAAQHKFSKKELDRIYSN